MNRAVFLDRDGTLVKTFPQDGLPPRGPRTGLEIEFLPGVELGCEALIEAGYRLLIVTNQPDVARGIVREHHVEWINYSIGTKLRCNSFFACYHDDRDGCCCRKPKPGMLYHAAVRQHLALGTCWMIGDSDRDYGAANAAGVKFLRTDGTNFLELAKWICEHSA